MLLSCLVAIVFFYLQRWNKRYFTVAEDKLFVSKNEDVRHHSILHYLSHLPPLPSFPLPWGNPHPFLSNCPLPSPFPHSRKSCVKRSSSRT